VKKIEPYFPNVVISSVEPKAVETAQFIAQEINTSFDTFEGLHEHDRTGVEFLSKEQFEANIHDFFKHPDQFVMRRETANQARQRFCNALTSILKKYPNKNIAVVSHGTVITLFVEKMTAREPFSFWKRLDLPSFVVFSLPQLKLITTVEHVDEQ
jgi:broad specificity phosphatase PhoE